MAFKRCLDQGLGFLGFWLSFVATASVTIVSFPVNLVVMSCVVSLQLF